MDLRFIHYDVKFFSDELLQQYLDSPRVRRNIKAWCIVLEEKLTRNEIF